MKIVFFGLTISSSWGNGHATPYRAILKGLHRYRHQVHFYEKDVRYYASHRDFDRCDFCHLHLYPDWDAVRASALRQALDADAVVCASFCPDGARIIDQVLDLGRPLKIFYDLDTPVTLGSLERGESEYLRRDQLPQFDLYLSFTGGDTLDELRHNWGVRLVRPLYGCVDPAVHLRTRRREKFACDLSYMGTYAADRHNKLNRLFLEPARQMRQNTFLLAGSMYPWEWQWPENVCKLEHVASADHAVLYSSSRLTLNITRKQMARWGYCPSGRFFEAAACGTPIVTDWFEGLDDFFDVDRELLVVNEAADVVSAICLPDLELREIAGRARERVLSQHTGEHRARELMIAIEQAASTTRNVARSGAA